MILPVDAYVQGVLAGQRAVLARAVTLVESNHPEHRRVAQEVLARLLPHTGRAHRIGVSGPPGAGKSTLVEALGQRVLARGHRLAVLAIDPSSTVTGGSILGDKTRMDVLSADERAFVRPSPSGGALGGVHRKTRESVLLCEAAGYDVVFVETVGVGQSEVTVAGLVDTFLVLLQPGSGDELQGIKKGILEVADVLAVTKADGEQAGLAQEAVVQFSAAMRLLRPASDGVGVPVLATSSVTGRGLDALWQALVDHRARLDASGALAERRASQAERWMWSLVEEEVLRALREHPEVLALAPSLVAAVREGTATSTWAAERLLAAWRGA